MNKRPLIHVGIAILVLCVAWTIWWQILGSLLTKEMARALADGRITSHSQPRITGFPFSLRVLWPDVSMNADGTPVQLRDITASLIPLPASSGWLEAKGGVTIERADPIVLNHARIDFQLPAPWARRDQWVITLQGMDIAYDQTVLHGMDGDIAVPVYGGPINGTIATSLSGYKPLLDTLVAKNVMKQNAARMANSFFDAMAAAQSQEGNIAFPLKIVDSVVYAGFIRLVDLASAKPAPNLGPLPIDEFAMPLQKTRSGDLGTDAPQAPAP